jgi:hypothetical protein
MRLKQLLQLMLLLLQLLLRLMQQRLSHHLTLLQKQRLRLRQRLSQLQM